MSPNPGVSPEENRDLQRLQQTFPTSTLQERKRFLDAKGGDFDKALEQLKAYIEWRTEYKLDSSYHCSSKLLRENHSDSRNDNNFDNNYSSTLELSRRSSSSGVCENEIWHSCVSDEASLDELDWKFASQTALWCEQNSASSNSTNSDQNYRAASPQHQQQAAATNTMTNTLPQLARILPPTGMSMSSCPRDQHGHRILQFLPARMDLSKASDKAFALSIALYLERKLNRYDDEKVLVAIDVRGGDGWANPRPQQLVPFIRQVAALLEQNFPERLARCVLFPVPAAATFLWRVVRVFLDPNTVTKIDFCKGDSRTSAPAPYRSMETHVSSPVLKMMEDFRVKSFVVEEATEEDQLPAILAARIVPILPSPINSASESSSSSEASMDLPTLVIPVVSMPRIVSPMHSSPLSVEQTPPTTPSGQSRRKKTFSRWMERRKTSSSRPNRDAGSSPKKTCTGRIFMDGTNLAVNA